ASVDGRVDSRGVRPHELLWPVRHKRPRRHKSWLSIDRGTAAWAASSADHAGRQRSGISIYGIWVISRLAGPIVFLKRNIAREVPHGRAKARLQAHLPKIRVVPLDI